MDYNKKRWTVLIAACVINIIIGTGYAWSVFAGPWAELLGVPSAALAFTVCNAVGPVTMITGGKINDALGPKWVVFVGGLMFGGGALIAGFSKSLGFLIFAYGIILGLGMGLVYSCTIGNTVKFFPDKKGMVGGLTTATYGLGSVILAPVAQAMVNSMGVATTFKILGIVYLVVICGGAFLITKCPDGFLPEGYTPPAPAAGMKAPTDKNWNEMIKDPMFYVLFLMLIGGAFLITKCPDGFLPEGYQPPAPAAGMKAPTDKNWNEMIKDPIFYVLFLMLIGGAFFGLMMISQCSAVAQRMIGLEPAVAATIVSILALGNAAGRVVCGFISDKIGRINTITAALVLAVVGLAMVWKSGVGTPNQMIFTVGIVFVGFCFGAFMGVYPGFTAEQFGMKNNGVNYGIMFIAFGVAGVAGPMIMTSRYAATESYSGAILIALAIAVAGLVLSFVYRAMSKSK